MARIPEDLTHRLGSVTVSKFMVEANPDIVMKAFSDAIVVRCEFMFHSNELEYIICRSEFDVVSPGSYPPKYELLFTLHDDRSVTFEWKKR